MPRSIKEIIAHNKELNTTKKICNGCGLILPREKFSKNKRGKFGLKSRCKDCIAKETSTPEAKAKVAERMRRYRKTDTYKMTQRNYQHKRRELKLSTSDGTIPIKRIITKELFELMEKQCNKCVICSNEIEFDSAHLDHIHPLSKGGKHSIDNVQWLCIKCNCSKGAKILERREESLL